MNPDPTPYDIFSYRGFAYMDTHPARMATMAALYGMNPTPVSSCRVLRIGLRSRRQRDPDGGSISR